MPDDQTTTQDQPAEKQGKTSRDQRYKRQRDELRAERDQFMHAMTQQSQQISDLVAALKGSGPVQSSAQPKAQEIPARPLGSEEAYPTETLRQFTTSEDSPPELKSAAHAELVARGVIGQMENWKESLVRSFEDRIQASKKLDGIQSTILKEFGSDALDPSTPFGREVLHNLDSFRKSAKDPHVEQQHPVYLYTAAQLASRNHQTQVADGVDNPDAGASGREGSAPVSGRKSGPPPEAQVSGSSDGFAERMAQASADIKDKETAQAAIRNDLMAKLYPEGR